MADDKKKPAPAPEGGLLAFNKDHHKEVLYLVLPGLLLLSILADRLMRFLDNLQYSGAYSFWGSIYLFFEHLWDAWKPIAVFIAVISAALTVYSYLQLKKIKEEEEKVFGHAPEDTFLDMGPAPKRENPKWVKVLGHANSVNPAEWRVAIIEADIMLDELLQTMGYEGAGVADRLKAVEPSDMLTLDKAWEAHKVRNRIAHSGTDFDLNDRETKRVIGLYEEVFNEFQII